MLRSVRAKHVRGVLCSLYASHASPLRAAVEAWHPAAEMLHQARLCLTNSGTGISPRRVAYGDLPVCKSEDDGLEARPTKNEEHSFDPSDRT